MSTKYDKFTRLNRFPFVTIAHKFLKVNIIYYSTKWESCRFDYAKIYDDNDDISKRDSVLFIQQ